MIETVKGLDFSGGKCDAARVGEAFGSALVRLVEGEQPHWRTGEPQRAMWAVFDAAQLRNTEAHGIAYRLGWTVAVEYGDTAP